MFIAKSKYWDLLNQIEHKDKSIVDLRDRYIETEKKLTEALNLKELLEEIVSRTGIPAPTKGNNYLTTDCGVGASWNSHELKLPDTVLQYTDDILGGKVIKQEGNKCLVISKDGSVKTGLTKAKTDKGYTYKLVRE